MADLTNCDIEPIHIPGKIQSHGFIIVIDTYFRIRSYSENICDFLAELPQPLLGLHINLLKPLIGKNEPADFLMQLISLGKTNGFDQTNPFHTDIQGKSFHLIISKSDEYYLFEFEPARSDNHLDLQKIIGRSISEILADKSLQNLLNNSVTQIKKIINYDRVMIYRFADDGHGEVVAEARNSDLEPWLGLHYPASDIPKQAREMYKLNLTRLIANVHTDPATLICDEDFINNPLDLTYSHLRAVSPVHIQYLKNMKVDSSFSISLVYQNELWGLIACHNYTPRFIDFKSRESSKLIGQILSSALEFRQDEEILLRSENFRLAVEKLSTLIAKSNSIEGALTEQVVTIKDVVDCSGAVLFFENNQYLLGETPNIEQLEDFIKWISNNIHDPLYYTSNLSHHYPEAASFKNIGSGVMIITLSSELKEYILWFKPEQLQTVKWAGRLEKLVELDENGREIISPRKSFEAWSQTVTATSENWMREEIKSALRLKSEVQSAIIQKASEIRILNEKLNIAYQELDTFSYTISHDLKNPLTTIKSFSQLGQRDKNLNEKTQMLFQRIEKGADKMHMMIKEVLEYSKVGRSLPEFQNIDTVDMIGGIISDLRVVYSNELIVEIENTPDVLGDPMMISQVFTNLLSNAIKYSQHAEYPKVTIKSRDDESQVIFSISDNGIGIDIKQLPVIFDLFKRADNVKEIEGSGVGLAIVKRIIDKHQGKIWVDSELGKGTTFYVAFKKQELGLAR